MRKKMIITIIIIVIAVVIVGLINAASHLDVVGILKRLHGG